MTELRSVASAERYRVFTDALRRRDQAQAETQRTQTQNFDAQLRSRELAEVDTRLAERRIQDRRDDIEAQRALQDQLRDQQRTRDFIETDNSFIRRRDAIEGELISARDARDLNESTLTRQLAGDRNDTAELSALRQRQEDLRQALLEREARIVERRADDRTAAIQQEIQLRRSIERIQSDGRNSQSGAERPRGGVLDVSG